MTSGHRCCRWSSNANCYEFLLLLFPHHYSSSDVPASASLPYREPDIFVWLSRFNTCLSLWHFKIKTMTSNKACVKLETRRIKWSILKLKQKPLALPRMCEYRSNKELAKEVARHPLFLRWEKQNPKGWQTIFSLSSSIFFSSVIQQVSRHFRMS